MAVFKWGRSQNETRYCCVNCGNLIFFQMPFESRACDVLQVECLHLGANLTEPKARKSERLINAGAQSDSRLNRSSPERPHLA